MSKKNLIVYVHGWNSHAKARKAQLLESELANHGFFSCTSLTLKNHPKEAIEQLIEFIESRRTFRYGFVNAAANVRHLLHSHLSVSLNLPSKHTIFK